ncbi:MAG: hypothetical protein M1353_12530 [Nitrospirae bacterium]|nr:hypothetical protein [Nitrospirota bacterium]
MYAIKYNGIEGLAGLKARVQRKADGKWWDAVAVVWAAAASANCDLALAETGGTPGEYTANPAFNPSSGGIYVISVYDGLSNLMLLTDDVYRPESMTAFQIINAVQRELRLPLSASINEAHAQLILSFINKVMLDIIGEDISWDALKVSCSFRTVEGIRFYTIRPVNTVSVDVVKRLQIGNDEPLDKKGDDSFREFQRVHTTAAQPLVYRIYARAGGSLVIEVCPTPDKAYQIDAEVLQKPEKLVNTDDVPLLDVDTIFVGTIAMAKSEQGTPSPADQSTFQAKLALQGSTNDEANWGDVEAV